MADHLICIDLFGIPGSGKSLLSHHVAGFLRARGYRVEEPSYRLDHDLPKLRRLFAKWRCTRQLFRKEPAMKQALLRLVSDCGYRGKEGWKQLLNVGYKLFLLHHATSQVLIFDEGILQSSISLSFKGALPETEIFSRLSSLAGPYPCIPVRLACPVPLALQNLAGRATHDSRVEQLDSDAAKTLLLRQLDGQADALMTDDTIVCETRNLMEASYLDSQCLLLERQIKMLR